MLSGKVELAQRTRREVCRLQTAQTREEWTRKASSPAVGSERRDTGEENSVLSQDPLQP